MSGPPPSELHVLQRYAELLGAALARYGAGEPVSDGGAELAHDNVIVLRGGIGGWPVPGTLVRWLGQLVAVAPVATLSIADVAGHRRPAYRGLLLYVMSQVGQLKALRPWYAALADEVGRCVLDGGPISATRGEEISSAAWAALSIFAVSGELAEPQWRDSAKRFLRGVVTSQRPGGAFFDAGPSDNLETLGYHELVLLHAMATFAVTTGDEDVRTAVFHAAEYVQNEVQPDHSTSQPWGLFSAIWNPLTRPLADQMLHAATAQRIAGDDAVSWMLLSDSLYCLKKLAAG